MDKFDDLQKKLVNMWEEIGSDKVIPESITPTIVVVPSISVDIEFPSSIQQAYEERMLFLLYLLKKTRMRIIYLTSNNIRPDIIHYYLETLPGMVSSNARRRLHLVSPEDGSSRPLTQKILDRPSLIEHIKSLIPDFDQAHMVPFNTTDLERELALRLDIPMYAADPRFIAFGTKSGCRRIFAEEGVQHPLGFEDLNTVDDVIQSIAKIRAKRPTVHQVVVKLNEGVSGLGNAMVDLNNLPETGSAEELNAIHQRLMAMKLEADDSTVEDYLENLEAGGAIVEEFISGEEVLSPSVQLRVTPLGGVEVLSTHDQMLGGPSGQSYLGAIFPADPAYSRKITLDSIKIGERFAKEGIIGRFALDFVVVKNENGEWESFAIEVNLRKGGTTAPYLILEYLTDGKYDATDGVFVTAVGEKKFYVASDHVESDDYKAFNIQLLFDIVSNHQLHYNHITQTGVIMHMLTGVSEFGRLGVTAIANAPQEAADLYHRFIQVLDNESAKLLNPQT